MRNRLRNGITTFVQFGAHQGCIRPRTLDTWDRYRNAAINLALGTDTYPEVKSRLAT